VPQSLAESICRLDATWVMNLFPLVWWFRSSLHYRRESVKRTSEPKPH
jgi:hypothetical protein